MTLIRVGILFTISGFMIGISYSEWTPILLTGIFLLSLELLLRLIEYQTIEIARKPDAIHKLQANQEEI